MALRDALRCWWAAIITTVAYAAAILLIRGYYNNDDRYCVHRCHLGAMLLVLICVLLWLVASVYVYV